MGDATHHEIFCFGPEAVNKLHRLIVFILENKIVFFY